MQKKNRPGNQSKKSFVSHGEKQFLLKFFIQRQRNMMYAGLGGRGWDGFIYLPGLIGDEAGLHVLKR